MGCDASRPSTQETLVLAGEAAARPQRAVEVEAWTQKGPVVEGTSIMGFDAFQDKMKKNGCTDAAIAAFKHNYDQLVAGVTGMMPESEISAVETLPRLVDVTRDPSMDQGLLGATAVLKLNGGLGTSMGLEKAKSLLEVKDGKTFLALIAEQVKYMRRSFGSDLKFILMNSFSTSADTKAHLYKNYPELMSEELIEMMQNMSPKVDAKTLAPASYPENPDMEWCPPGHGDIYPSLVGSGFMHKLLEKGVKYVFVSNSDNLGATLDLDCLSYFANSNMAFMMEVCERTASDKKGGHLCIRKSDNKFTLRESAMCPDDDKKFFEDIALHKFFNTNNLWVNLEKLQATLEAHNGALPLPLIKNKKTVNPRDSKSEPVFQLETAMGSAIECFDEAGAIVVPRTRFAPVKTCSDLFVLRSDVYKIQEDFTIKPVVPVVPIVKLDDSYYKLVDQMEALTPVPPSLVGCKALTVKGPVKFCGNVTIKGGVVLEAVGTQPVEVKDTEFDNVTEKLEPAMAFA